MTCTAFHLLLGLNGVPRISLLADGTLNIPFNCGNRSQGGLAAMTPIFRAMAIDLG